MASQNPMQNVERKPTKEALEDYLGPGRYRRFDLTYEEFVDMKLTPQVTWNKQEKSWQHDFLYKGKTLFSIRWGIDYFYAYMIIPTKIYVALSRNEAVSPDSVKLMRKFPPNKMRGTTRVEANLEIINDNEAFLDLLPFLLKVI